MMKRFLFALIALLAFGFNAHATVYYMAMAGSDAANGRTEATAWATLQHADDILAQGDILFIRGGNYTNTQYFVSQRSGIAGQPIVLTNYPGERPVFTGYNNPTAQGGNGEHVRFMLKHSYITLNGLASIRGWDMGWADQSIEVVDIIGPGAAIPGAHHITITNCSFKGDPSAAWIWDIKYVARIVLIAYGASYIKMDQDTFLYAGESQGGVDPQLSGATLYVLNNCHHITLTNSYVGLGPHAGIEITNFLSDPNNHIILRNNVFDGAGPGGAADWGGGHDISLGAFNTAADTLIPTYMVVENNIFYPSWRTYRAKAGFLMMGGSAVTLRKNFFWDAGNQGIAIESNGSTYANHYQANVHNFIYNNTVVNTGLNAIHLRTLPISGAVDLNKMFYDNLYANNLFYNGHQHRCWPDGATSCEGSGPGSAWEERGYMFNTWFSAGGAAMTWWVDPTQWGRNLFKNNLISQFDPDSTNYACIYDPVTNDGAGYSKKFSVANALEDSLPGVFIDCQFQVDPEFDVLDSTTATLDVGSPCIDAGLATMNQLDTVVTHLLTHDEAWAREAGLDTMVWSGTAPDIGAFEYDSGPPEAPECTVQPTTLGYGTWAVGDTATAQLFKIKNTGDVELPIDVSESCADFYISSGSGEDTLAVGDSLMVSVVFAPVSDGAKACTLDTGNAVCSDVIATGGACTLTPSTITFTGTRIGDCSDVHIVTMSNSGAGAITGTISEACPDFTIIAGGGAYVLTTMDSRDIHIQFCPLSSGEKTCTINF